MHDNATPVLAEGLAIIGSLENGEVKRDLTAAIIELVHDMNDQSMDRKGKTFKGSVTLKLDVSVTDGMVSILADVSAKAPKRPRSSTIYFAMKDGRLSSSHPGQADLFRGPTEVPDLKPAAANTATA